MGAAGDLRNTAGAMNTGAGHVTRNTGDGAALAMPLHLD